MFFTKMCKNSRWYSKMCWILDAWMRTLSEDLPKVAKKHDVDCYQMYKRSQMIGDWMHTCTQKENNTYDIILATDCLLIKEWASVLKVYSSSRRKTRHLPIARETNCSPNQKWFMPSNSSTTLLSPNNICTSQKMEFMSECSLSLAKQENQTWNQTVSSWYQIKHQIMKHESNFIAPTAVPTEKPRKCGLCIIS